MTIAIIHKPSPNFNDRDTAVPLQYVVLHYTGMKTADEALQRLCDPASQVSCHYFIDENGTTTQLVADDKRAWHAGKSFWRGVTDINSASIGIELVNPGHQFGYRAFPAAQIVALQTLLARLYDEHQFKSHALLAHSDVAPDRKEDPGELFPWDQLAKAGFGIWPQVVTGDDAPATDTDVQKMLIEIGYNCPNHGEYDRDMRTALLAFQRHYEPDNMTGTPEFRTIARLRAVLRAIPD